MNSPKWLRLVGVNNGHTMVQMKSRIFTFRKNSFMCLKMPSHKAMPRSKENAPAGNRTRVASVAGMHDTSTPPALAVCSALVVGTIFPLKVHNSSSHIWYSPLEPGTQPGTYLWWACVVPLHHRCYTGRIGCTFVQTRTSGCIVNLFFELCGPKTAGNSHELSRGLGHLCFLMKSDYPTNSAVPHHHLHSYRFP